jgi:hypothetical protein
MTDNSERMQLARKLASNAYRTARLKKIPGVTADIVVSNLARVLISTSPRSDHGRLIMRAMRGGVPAELRTDDEKTVRYLLSHGQAPTISAVSGRLAELPAIHEAQRKRREYAETVTANGAAVAEAIARKLAETGESYTWQELRKLMDWPSSPRYLPAIMTALERDGWITSGRETRSLRPGARFPGLLPDFR